MRSRARAWRRTRTVLASDFRETRVVFFPPLFGLDHVPFPEPPGSEVRVAVGRDTVLGDLPTRSRRPARAPPFSSVASSVPPKTPIPPCRWSGSAPSSAEGIPRRHGKNRTPGKLVAVALRGGGRRVAVLELLPEDFASLPLRAGAARVVQHGDTDQRHSGGRQRDRESAATHGVSRAGRRGSAAGRGTG